MIEETHRRLAQEIGKFLNLKKEQVNLLEQGSVLPDYELGDEHGYPHHKDSERAIKYLMCARESYWKNDDECYLHLGIAFHYIQDVWISKSGASPLHSKWEERVDKATFLSEDEFAKLLDEAPLPAATKRSYLIILKKFRDITQTITSSFFEDEIGKYMEKEWGRMHLEHASPEFGDYWTWTNRARALNVNSEDEGSVEARARAEIGNVSGLKMLIILLKTTLDLLRKGRSLNIGHGDKGINLRYSTPEIDYNVAFRICLFAGVLILSKNL